MPYGSLQLAISSLLGAACGSTAWVQTGLAVHGWMLGSFTDEAQRAVWSTDPDAAIATATSPLDGSGKAVPGGIVIDGTWEFASGCDAATWILTRVTLPPGVTRWCLFPRESIEIVDVWYATGLRGSGSQNVRARELFVPDAFTLDVLALRGAPCGLYGLPYVGVFQFAICAPALGLAKGSLEAFRRHSAERSDRRGSAARQLRFARSAAEVDAAELLLARTAAAFEAAAAQSRLLAAADRIRFKRDAAYAARLCRTAVDRLVQVLGAHGLADAHPIQRALRDIVAISSHHGLAWDTSGELFGSHAFGIEPADPMLSEELPPSHPKW